MEEKPSVKKNYMYSMIYQGLIMVLPLVTAPYLSRVVGAEGTGIYAFTYSIAQYFVYFGMLGVSNYGNRGIAKVRENYGERVSFFSSVYQLQITTTIISISAYLVYCFLFVDNNKDIAILQLFFVASSLFDISWLFWGMENFKVTVTRQIIVKVGSPVGVFIFVKSPSDLWKYTMILSGGTFLSQLYLFIKLKMYARYTPVKMSESFRHFKTVFILVIPIIATSIYRVMDKVMIGALSNKTEVGYYEYSDKLITTSLGIVGALGSVMLPKMANLVSKGDLKQQHKYLIKSIEVTMLIAFAICFGIFSISDMFIPFFYGEEYYPSINITKLLCVSVPFIAWANVVRMQYLIPNERDKVYVWSIVIGALTNIAVNFALIPNYGAFGAAIGTVCAEAIVMLVQTFASIRYIPIVAFVKKSIPFFFIGLTMLFVVQGFFFVVGSTNITMFVSIIIGGAWYTIASLIYLYYTQNEMLLSILSKIKNLKHNK